MKQKDEEGKKLNPALETTLIVVAALAFAFLVQWLLVKPYKIPSLSMFPLLEVDQRILVNRVEGRFGTPERGDVIVFNPPPFSEGRLCGISDGEQFGPPTQTYIAPVDLDDSSAKPRESFMACPVANPGKQSQAFIKRLIGLPGERIKIVDGHAFINGKKLDEPYLNTNPSCDEPQTFIQGCNFTKEFTIPTGKYFFLGDNRAASQDSRYWGPISADHIIGEAFATYWPVNRVGGL